MYSFGIDGLYHFNVTPNLVPFLSAGIGGLRHDGPQGQGFYPEYAFNYGAGLKYFVADNVAVRADMRHAYLPDDHLNNLEYTAGVTFQFGGVTPAARPADKAAADSPVVAADTTRPTVILTSPGSNTTGADTILLVSAAFSEPMDQSTFHDRTFTLKKGQEAVAGNVKATSASSAGFTARDRLEPGTTYTARIGTAARDLAGNALSSDYVWNFTTAALAQSQATPAKVTKTETIVVKKFVMFGNSHFEFDQATLTPEGKEMLKQNVKIMRDIPALNVRVSGYASASGSVQYNQDLSERRAEAAKSYMVQEGGIVPDRIVTIGYGEMRPAAFESDPSNIESDAAKANMRIFFEVVENR